MKIFIGITQNQQEIGELLEKRAGAAHSVTEIGPFLSREDAQNWCEHLRLKIPNIEEITSQATGQDDGGWYGFTFEQPDLSF